MSVSQKTFTDDSGLPTWEELENAPGTDYKCAWGLFDKDGKKDQTGTLNLLTPARVLNAARSEIRTGDSVSLNWGLENVKFPGFSRKAMSQNVIDLSILGFCGHDDELTFNTQCGSQVSRIKATVVLRFDRHSGMDSGMLLIRGRRHIITV